MKEYVILAEYKVTKELVVLVADGANPLSEEAWVEIISESDLDCQLFDIDRNQQVEENK